MANFTKGEWVIDYGCTIGHIKAINSQYHGTPTVLRYDVLTLSITDDERNGNASLACAAGNAATAIEAMGYDGIKAIEMLPEMVKFFEWMELAKIKIDEYPDDVLDKIKLGE